MENKTYLNQLLQKYLDNEASEAELQVLFSELEANRNDAEWEELLLPVFREKRPERDYKPGEWEEIIEAILHQQPAPAAPARVVRFPLPRMVAAAAALLAIATGVLLWQNHMAGEKATQVTAKQDVGPIGNRAVLTLADGTTVLLDSAANGLLAQQGATQITKNADGAVTYNEAAGHTTRANTYNSLSTPRGGQFKLTLPDGTRVWLNAATTLRYPVAFSGNERRVEMTGEAYFEVASNAKAPFAVVSANQEVKVLGTAFNINAYTDEARTKTTLLQGSVRVAALPASPGSKSAVITLQPGQQALLNNNGLEVDNDPDMQEVLAWKNGQLDLRNLDVKALMRQLSRWYDVDVVFQGPVPTGAFGGILDHRLYLSNILEVLEARGIHCKLEGKKLYVSSR
ncbi:FecR family protein [Filimonas effusa]|uniref:FecR family protein n=1 Tax=Filimonas effusa TaxID=2508721 RepID=A0A4Q1D0K5_9BACT|nr:FecR family protein [Filimonas effusa]RXK81192.1 FecR family protein [Filimonas effusa]